MNYLLPAALFLMTSYAAAPTPALIPKPAVCETHEGSFTLTHPVAVAVDPSFAGAGRILAEQISADTGLAATAEEPVEGKPYAIRMIRVSEALPPEGYSLEISPEGVAIRAKEAAGIFYGGQTLRQLLPLRSAKPETWSLPFLTVSDAPRFGWRGLMMDCSRTFVSMDYLRRYVDRIAYYKMNVLHLHLTDDQGWRMEIERHPKLTEIGSKFDAALKNEVSGYYTKQELRDLVQYAADRNVLIVPEIEMPSHALAALASYPELSCRGDDYRIVPFMMMLDPKGEVTTPYVVFCAGNDQTFKLLEDVLAEVIEVFPSKYIHIGGDECPKDFWKTCAKCQARMKTEGLKDENELQSYFVKRIEKFVNAKGRVLLGWDEILEGGLAPNAAVMSWRGVNGGIEAAKAGHPVVMSPTTHCYLDYDHLGLPLRKVYSYEPIPPELTPEQGKLVLGAQGNMWTHIARTEEEIDAQIFPRLIALAEVTWSPAPLRDWTDFEGRMKSHYARLESFGAAYYKEAPTPTLAVAPGGAPWAVHGNRAYTWTGSGWEAKPGELRELVFAPDGRAYAVGTKPQPGGYELLEGNGTTWKSVPSDRGAVHIAVAPDGALWALDDENAVRVLRNGQWENRTERLCRIAAASDGAMWALGPTTLGGGFDILEWTGKEWRSLGNGAAAVEIAAVPGELWAVNSLGAVFVRRNGAWEGAPINLRVLAASPDGTLYGLTPEARGAAWRLHKYQDTQWRPQDNGTLSPW